MNLRELERPLRALWDLGAGAINRAAAVRIAGELVADGILSVEIEAPQAPLGPSVFDVATVLAQAGRAVSLTLPVAAALTPAAESSARQAGIREVFLRLASAGELALGLGQRAALSDPSFVGISLMISDTHLAELPHALDACLDAGVRRVALPQPRVNGGLGARLYGPQTPADLQSAVGALAKLVSEGIDLAIHDPLLAQLAGLPPQSGCQAASALIFISASLDVYPCSLLPLPLGSLRRESLAAILAGAPRADVRRRLAIPPRSCRGCARARACGGGCRGRSYAATGSIDEPDPACAGPRAA